MKCFYAASTELHDPVFRLSAGVVAQNAEQAERAHLLLAGLAKLGFATEEPAADVPRDILEKVHTQRFLQFMETAWDEWQTLPNAGKEVVPNVHALNKVKTYPSHILGKAGWHLGDTSAPIGEHSWEAALAGAATAYAAAQAVLQGADAAYGLCRPPGHHSSADVAAGHCIVNNTATAVETLRTKNRKVAVLDIDVHHGNGTQDIFYERGDVLTISIHATPEDYYPFFVGYANEAGAGAGEGFNVNMPLARSTSDDGWCDTIATALDRIAEFAPDALVVALGLDAHENDPLKGLQVTFDGFTRAGSMIAGAGLPTVLIQEGGYLSPDLSTSLTAFLSGYTGRK
ncbi:Acetylpolyamine aminohydrolase [Thalassovita gelatinovora]|uniref:Acetylpolyamine aminohydrolase n=1 Tax=Thalassovita gelatinovora TaxID=53501 RepID=A0A0P1G103_THAGE|nr:histone deacetylase family protein [Thalassovita gelatinovora]QIZ80447.1 histone deacetylase family protein [Thalassovita gelatinovora]CUH65854.1 Acetylpolyamine aminohydrolase [Thalassovita gelatinovora]SEQ72728.1 Acetoin utilization deacetylase AcuC [Thalassovita gelatinovora]